MKSKMPSITSTTPQPTVFGLEVIEVSPPNKVEWEASNERGTHKAGGHPVRPAPMGALSTRPGRASPGKQFACEYGGVRNRAAA